MMHLLCISFTLSIIFLSISSRFFGWGVASFSAGGSRFFGPLSLGLGKAKRRECDEDSVSVVTLSAEDKLVVDESRDVVFDCGLRDATSVCKVGIGRIASVVTIEALDDTIEQFSHRADVRVKDFSGDVNTPKGNLVICGRTVGHRIILI
jgi:hypothetical protein